MAPTLNEILPSRDEMVERILATFRSASDEQMADGVTWYSTAHHLAVRLDPQNPMRAAGVVAALSTRMEWGRNMFLAERTFSEGKAYGCLTASCGKANKILADRGIDRDGVLKILNAPKTQSFFVTILDPSDVDTVVIDRHAVAIALGRPSTDADMAVLNRKGAYEYYANAYRAAAYNERVLPSTMQAVTWVVWRETEIRTAAAVRRQAGRA